MHQPIQHANEIGQNGRFLVRGDQGKIGSGAFAMPGPATAGVRIYTDQDFKSGRTYPTGAFAMGDGTIQVEIVH